jgi:hypothetical protein
MCIAPAPDIRRILDVCRALQAAAWQRRHQLQKNSSIYRLVPASERLLWVETRQTNKT